MSMRGMHRDLARNFGAAASEHGNSGTILIAPWQIDANRRSLDRGFEDCGCAFAPDEPDDKKAPKNGGLVQLPTSDFFGATASATQHAAHMIEARGCRCGTVSDTGRYT